MDFEKELKNQEFKKDKEAVVRVVSLGKKLGSPALIKKFYKEFKEYYNLQYDDFKRSFQRHEREQRYLLMISEEISNRSTRQLNNAIEQFDEKLNFIANEMHQIKDNGLNTKFSTENRGAIGEKAQSNEIPPGEIVGTSVMSMKKDKLIDHEIAANEIDNDKFEKNKKIEVNEKEGNVDDVNICDADKHGNKIAEYKGEEVVIRKDLSRDEEQRIIQDMKNRVDDPVSDVKE